MPDDIKICHVTSVHPRYDVRIFHKECQSLAQKGHHVTLLVADVMVDELIDNIQIVSTHYVPHNLFQRFISMRRYIKRKMLDIDANIYHFHDPELLPVAAWIKRKNKNVIFDFHEDVARQILFKSWIPQRFRSIISALYQRYEYRLAKQFDALISVTPALVSQLKRINPNTYMVTNYPKVHPVIREILVPKTRSICFAGGIYSQWNHINILKAIETIPNVKYILAGSGSASYLDSLKELPGWHKVEYLGRLSHKEVIKLYDQSSAGLALLGYDTQVGREGTLGNTKIFEYMDASLPFICSDNRIWREIVEKHHCGILVDPNNIDEIRTAIEYILDHKCEAEKMGNNGRKAIELSYNWQSQADHLFEIYQKLCQTEM